MATQNTQLKNTIE